MTVLPDALLARLDHHDAAARAAALAEAEPLLRDTPPLQPPVFNLHAHSFFSYNGEGYSPTGLVARAKAQGLYAIGLVDFDVLDGMAEFLGACAALGIRGAAGVETRAFVAPLADQVINSPGEPGIAYHLALGFVPRPVVQPEFLARLRDTAGRRTRQLVERVNAHTDPLCLDFERDIAPMTPAGNATERHVCAAYRACAEAHYPAAEERAGFWAEKLREPEEKVAALLVDPVKLEALMRARLMKQGGPGYVVPNGPDFPRVEDFNAFARANGAIPTHAWLDGVSPGEEDPGDLLDLMIAAGAVATNVIPDRNWNIADPEVRRDRVARLHAYAAAAAERDLPVFCGTEMNAPGQRFVDDFAAEALQPLYPQLLQGAHILYAHTRLEAEAGQGYTSAWAEERFQTRRARNAFFARIGGELEARDPIAPALLAIV